MGDISERLREFYDQEMAERALRPVGEEREARLADFVRLCEREGLGSVVEVGVIRPGGILEVGVWGGDEDREWSDEHGRYFRSRTDDRLLALLAAVGEVSGFDTWSWFEDGGHYQWARVVVA